MYVNVFIYSYVDVFIIFIQTCKYIPDKYFVEKDTKQITGKEKGIWIV